MKYEFFKDNGKKMVRIECDPTNVVVREATDQDYLDAENHAVPDVQPTAGTLDEAEEKPKKKR